MVALQRSHWLTTSCGYVATMFSQLAFGADTPVAAQGRVEGQNPTASLAFAQTGRLESIAVFEGQSVKQGQVLAALECKTIEAQLQEAAANLDIAKRGGRVETVAVKQADVEALDAEVRRYEAQVRRLTNLAARDLTAKSSLEDAQLLVKATQARRDVAEKAVVEARNPQPAQERQAASAQVEALKAQVRECTLLAPSDGVVLRRLLEPGAAVSSVMPEAVVLFADTRTWHVRAEVDEADLAKVRLGQSAIVTAPAFGNAEVKGKVVRLADVMGRRTILSGDPAEKMDRDVREVVVRLDRVPPTPVVGLRVKVRFLP